MRTERAGFGFYFKEYHLCDDCNEVWALLMERLTKRILLEAQNDNICIGYKDKGQAEKIRDPFAKGQSCKIIEEELDKIKVSDCRLEY